MKRIAFLVSVYIAAALASNYAVSVSFLIKYILMLLLYFSFLKVKFRFKPVYSDLFLVSLVMIITSLACYLLLQKYNPLLAESAVMIALTPTALASIFMASMLGGNMEKAASNVVAVNILMIIIMPFTIELFYSNVSLSLILKAFYNSFFIFVVPLILAIISRKFKSFSTYVNSKKNLMYSVWTALIFLSVAKSVNFLRYNNSLSINTLAGLFLISFLLCFGNFALGKLIGRGRYSVESSLALGHKNNGFTIWFCLTFLTPASALGPAIYILFQNLYLVAIVSYRRNKLSR